MNKAIAIFRPIGYPPSPFLHGLLESIETEYPILITNHSGYQIDALKQTFERTNYEEIFFLNESMIVKDNSAFSLAFEEYSGKTVHFGVKMQMFLGKYIRSVVEKTIFPEPKDRLEDIVLGEDLWHRQYERIDPRSIIYIEPMCDTNSSGFEEKFGRMNLVLENRYFKKWKHHWNISMVDGYSEERVRSLVENGS